MYVIKQGTCLMWISLLIKEKGFGFLSASCSSKPLKFIDFLSSLGGVPVFNLPIENFNFSKEIARFVEGLSPSRPAGRQTRRQWVRR